MQWHYAADNGQQFGPISDAELETLLRDGKINQSTLVWHAGQADWQPLATARPTPPPPPPLATSLPGTTCVECGRTFPPNELVRLNKSLVCAACKPVFLQRMTEGVAVSGGGGIWRKGKKIMTVSETPFPDRCVKCNAPANGFRLKRVLYWQHPAYFLLLFCNLLVMLIVMLIVRKKAVLHIGLCEKHRKQRLIAIIACSIGMLGGLISIIAGAVMPSGIAVIVGIVIFLAGAIWGVAKGRAIYATKIDKQNVWVGGAGKDFLDQLPESPD